MQYPSIRIEGAILSSDIIDAIERGEKGFQKAKDFGLDPTSKVKDEIASTWADARDQWRICARKVESLKEGATGTTETRNFWMSPFMGLLSYNVELAAKGEEVNGRNYAISHRDTKRAGFPIHIVAEAESPAGGTLVARRTCSLEDRKRNVQYVEEPRLPLRAQLRPRLPAPDGGAGDVDDAGLSGGPNTAALLPALRGGLEEVHQQTCFVGTPARDLPSISGEFDASDLCGHAFD
jgi:hypothetical protein